MNILIIDDEKTVCDMMESLLKRYFKRNASEIAVNILCFEKLSWLLTYFDNGNGADIIFMDIKLKASYNGIDLARKIQEINKSAVIIFMTGYIEYAEEIFKAKPFYFLIKPVTYERVEEVMNKAVAYRKEKLKSMLWFKIENVAYSIDKRDIYYIEAERKNVLIHTKEKIYKVNTSFKSIEEETGDIMIKCHRSYMVNPEKVRKCSRTEIELISGMEIPVSRAKSNEVAGRICIAAADR